MAVADVDVRCAKDSVCRSSGMAAAVGQEIWSDAVGKCRHDGS
jgi:hypothetical protein